MRRQFVDVMTERVERDDQVKGDEAGKDEYVDLKPGEVQGAVPRSDRTPVRASIDVANVDGARRAERPPRAAPAPRKKAG